MVTRKLPVKENRRSLAQAAAGNGSLPRYIELPIDEVKDDPRNENVHTDEQIVLLRASVRLYDQEEDLAVRVKIEQVVGLAFKHLAQFVQYTKIHARQCTFPDTRSNGRLKCTGFLQLIGCGEAALFGYAAYGKFNHAAHCSIKSLHLETIILLTFIVSRCNISLSKRSGLDKRVNACQALTSTSRVKEKS